MAAPGYSLGAHDGRGSGGGEVDQRLEIVAELGRLHVIGEPPEGSVAPGAVDRVGTRLAEPAESGHVVIVDPVCLETFRERLAIELRVEAGARDGADVDQLTDPVNLQEVDEFRDRSRGVPDGADGLRVVAQTSK